MPFHRPESAERDNRHTAVDNTQNHFHDRYFQALSLAKSATGLAAHATSFAVHTGIHAAKQVYRGLLGKPYEQKA